MKYGASPLMESNQLAPVIDTRPACLLDGISPREREQTRKQVLENWNLLNPAKVPIFEEAAQTVARLLSAPICLLSIFDQDSQIFKAAVGLSSLGLMNQLASSRELPRAESFCTHVVESTQTLMLEDTTQYPAFSNSLLVQRYGIHAYLGVPLMASNGICIGTLAVMDLMPRKFTAQEIAILELNARWSISEYEKHTLLSQRQPIAGNSYSSPSGSSGEGGSPMTQLQSQISEVRLGLISQLTQDLRNPLTAITGMASMLSREIYGPLTNKQQEYANIVLESSQNLLTLVDEIIELGNIKEESQQLSFAPVDIEMLAQQSLQPLEKIIKQLDLNLNLTVEPGSRIWVLDKRVVKQLIYHLIFSIAQMATAGSTLRVHISRKDERLHIAVWVSNPWLGEDLPQTVITWAQQHLTQQATHPDLWQPAPELANELADSDSNAKTISRQELGLLLSQHLTEIHEGDVSLQGSVETGYRYVISLPSKASS
jgi:signal transduction histidine kinase